MISKEAVSQRLRSNGVKPTTQRLEVGMLLLATPQHMSADQILADLRQSGSRISKATVYNTLNLFSSHGLVSEVSVDSTRQFFDSTIEPHHHFYNVDTGEITDIKNDDLLIEKLPALPEGTEAQGVEVVVKIRNSAS